MPTNLLNYFSQHWIRPFPNRFALFCVQLLQPSNFQTLQLLSEHDRKVYEKVMAWHALNHVARRHYDENHGTRKDDLDSLAQPAFLSHIRIRPLGRIPKTTGTGFVGWRFYADLFVGYRPSVQTCMESRGGEIYGLAYKTAPK